MTYDQVSAWIEKYVQAWRNNDVAKLADLFATDATYKETPWGDTIKGLPDIQKFWQEVCANQGDVEVHSNIVAVEGAKVEVHLQVTYKTDKPSKWRDVWALTFNNEGLCDSYLGWPWPQHQQN